MTPSLTLTSLQAFTADVYCYAVADYLTRRLGVQTHFLNLPNWLDRQAALDRGVAQLGWICGMPYVQRAAGIGSRLELLTAPIYLADRYQKRPIYFSDVVVRADSGIGAFAELRGKSWGFNEPGSQSGFHVVRHFLAQEALSWQFFGRIVATGGHRKSLQHILNGRLDAAALDSTVLDTELAHNLTLAQQIRIIAVMGPSPVPPWVVAPQLPATLRADIRAALLHMHEDETGGRLLREVGIDHFTAVTDADYEPIRQMAQAADAAGLEKEDAFLTLPHVSTWETA